MGAISSVDGNLLSSSGAFYGGSSAAHFLQEVHCSLGGSAKPHNTIYTNRASYGQTMRHPAPHPRQPQPAPGLGAPYAFQQDLVLPTRQLADYLLDIYWTKSYNLYPFIHRRSFQHAYANLWASAPSSQTPSPTPDLGLGSAGTSDPHSPGFHCALNAVFALASQLAGPELPLSDRRTLSERFFRRAEELLHVDVLDYGSLALVQTLLILAQYLQSTQFPTRCWNAVGLACRIGQGLGLHVEGPEGGRGGVEGEMRRRIWHGCHIMDR